MQKYTGEILNQLGHPISGATVTVSLTGTTTPVAVYSTDATDSPAPNPMSVDAVGSFSFYVADGRYDITVTGTDITTTIRSDVEISDNIGSSSVADTRHVIYNSQTTLTDISGLSSAPGLSASGTGRLYFDTSSNKVKLSENGGAYALIGSGASSNALLDGTNHTDTTASAVDFGATVYGNATPKWTRLAGNVSATKKMLSQTGSGAVSAAPVWATLVAGDIPTHNHSAADVTSGTLPEARGGTNQSAYTLGQILYASATDTLSKLSGNTTTTKKFLTQTGNGSVSAAPGWNIIATGDLGSGSATSTKALKGDLTWGDPIVACSAISSTTTTVANTVTETAIKTWTPAANDCDVVNRAFRIRVGGTYSVTGTPTLKLQFVVAGGGGPLQTFTTPSGVTGEAWDAELFFIRFSTGVSGQSRMSGQFIIGNGTLGVAPVTGIRYNTINWDGTASQNITLNVTWGTASASNTISAFYFIVERLNS